MSVLATALRMILFGGLLISVALVWWLDRPNGAWIGRLRERLLLGVPWGTVITATLVLTVYLWLQHGISDWANPLTLPYVSWSYLYPLGLVTAAFAHTGPAHLTGNLIGTLLLAPFVEYVWSHYPQRRGSMTFGSLRWNPYVRAFIIFPLTVVIVGFATALFHWGPIIGFSGVVFAFAGFALVRYPIATVIAITARGAVSTTYQAMLEPVVTASPGPSYGGPWWAGIAIEGHLFGLVLGAVVGAVLLNRRDNLTRPSAGRLWIGTVVAASSLTLWAVWWYGDGNSFVLYRGVGVVLIVTLGILFVAAVRASSTDLRPQRLAEHLPRIGISRRRVATMTLVLALSTMAVVAVPVNLTTVDPGATPGEGVMVQDYRVLYAEDVRNQNVPAVDVSVLARTTNVTTSGVIVVNRQRHLWTREVSAGALAFFGYANVKVGGPMWEETVRVRRQGWVPAGGAPVYQVWLKAPEEPWEHVFSSQPQAAEPLVSGRTITIVADEDQFVIEVSQGGAILDREPIPPVNESARIGGIRFVRDDSRLVAVIERTRITIAREEEYA